MSAPVTGARPDGDTPLLEVRDLVVNHGQLRALDAISLRVFPGEVYAMIGANGAGKSTLLRTIAGLHAPSAGSVLFDGADVTAAAAGTTRPPRHRHGAGGPPALRVALGGRESAGRRHLRAARPVDDRAGLRAVRLDAGPAGTAHRSAVRRRAADGGIGRALVANPRVLLLDELSLGLAPVVVQRIYAMLPQILATGLTVLLVEQDVSQALRVATHVHCLLEGRTTLESRPADVTPEQVEAAYFGLAGAAAEPARGREPAVMAWVNAIIQGVLTGGLYALFACGLSLMFGVMKVVNLAHGDLAVIAGYVAVGVITVTHIPVLWSFLIVLPVMAVLGYGLQRTVIQSALDRGVLTTLLVTFGLSVVIENGLLQFFTANSRGLGTGLALVQDSFTIGSQIQIAYLLVVIFAVAVVVLLGLQYFLSGSKYGRLIRASADDQEAVQLAGVDYRHVFGIAAAVAFGTVALGGHRLRHVFPARSHHRHGHHPAVRLRRRRDRRPRIAVGHAARRDRARRRPADRRADQHLGRGARRVPGVPGGAGTAPAGPDEPEDTVMSLLAAGR